MSLARHLHLIATAALVLAGCGKGREAPPAAMPSSSLSAVTVPRAQAPVAPGVARKVEIENDVYDFDYEYPAQAAGIPALRRLLDVELDRTKAELVKEATDGQADAKKNDYPFRTYSSGTAWSVVTDLPGWLSLSATVGTYSGGAHGMTVFDTLLWDKRANVRRQPLDLFASKAAFRAALARPMCEALNRERLKRREGETYGPDDEFGKCIDPVTDATIILGSSSRQRFDRIGFLIPPYNAGPYAEGPYELTLPITPAMTAAVRPEYRDAFAAR